MFLLDMNIMTREAHCTLLAKFVNKNNKRTSYPTLARFTRSLHNVLFVSTEVITQKELTICFNCDTPEGKFQVADLLFS